MRWNVLGKKERVAKEHMGLIDNFLVQSSLHGHIDMLVETVIYALLRLRLRCHDSLLLFLRRRLPDNDTAARLNLREWSSIECLLHLIGLW